ncbi:hypothetical protein J6590_088654 [Homalodisca vitripennis]|nr:hypothetical protein J6590_088654 [Homalodisca vitripennis]
MPRFLTPREAAKIRFFVQQGRSYREVADLSDNRRRGQGLPRATSEADDRFVRRNALRNRTSTSKELQAMLRTTRNVHFSPEGIE